MLPRLDSSLLGHTVFPWGLSLKLHGQPLPQPAVLGFLYPVPSKVALVDAQKEQVPHSGDKACCWVPCLHCWGHYEQWDQASCCRVPVILKVLGECTGRPRQGGMEGALNQFL